MPKKMKRHGFAKRRARRQHPKPDSLPWQSLQNAEFYSPNGSGHGPQTEEEGFVGVFRNHLYQVTMREFESASFGTMVWLIIRRTDSEAVHDWRHLQRIKNELCGVEREAVEIYPAESRLVDASNQYHLFVFPKDVMVPFGYLERDVADISHGSNKNRPFDIRPTGLNERTGKTTIKTVGG